MRVNIINKTAIIRQALESLNRSDINPRLTTALSVSTDCFKVTSVTDNAVGVLINKTDLGELFASVPQSLVGITFGDSDVVDVSKTQTAETLAGLDTMKAEYIVDNLGYEVADSTDTLGVYFCQWKRLVGLNDLPRQEVDLTSDGSVLTVDARNATLFKGSLTIQIQ